jgi:SagB-type dehydrogenase family enzyme
MSEIIRLPTPKKTGDISLEAALYQRRTIRSFLETPLGMESIGQLLWAAQGLTTSNGLRTAPSAGALYPLEVYVAAHDLLGRYLPESHSIEVIHRDDLRKAIASAAFDQEFILQAPCSFLLAAVPERTQLKYGADRSPRYIEIEVGHAAQNLLLQATALGLGSVPVGAFDDQRIAGLFRLPSGQSPLYLIPVGRPMM